MNIKTPLMFYRGILETAGVTVSSYLPYISVGHLLLKGSSTTLQGDFSNTVYTPTGTFSRDSSGVPQINTSATEALTTGAHPTYTADKDFLFISVGKADTAGTLLIDSLGASTTTSILNKWTTTTGGSVRDDVATAVGTGGPYGAVVASGMTSASTGMAALAEASIALITSVDAAGPTETVVETIVYNLDTAANYTSGTGTSDNGVTSARMYGAYTLGTTTRINGWLEYYGKILFAFPGGSLPATWDADSKAIAEVVLALHA